MSPNEIESALFNILDALTPSELQIIIANNFRCVRAEPEKNAFAAVKHVEKIMLRGGEQKGVFTEGFCIGVALAYSAMLSEVVRQSFVAAVKEKNGLMQPGASPHPAPKSHNKVVSITRGRKTQ